jgi:hypothetical protein
LELEVLRIVLKLENVMGVYHSGGLINSEVGLQITQNFGIVLKEKI